jgi:hypothetical protein
MAQGNTAQQTRFQNINDLYGIARWEMEGKEIHIWDDDGDEAMIHEDGTASWKIGDGWKKEEIV